MRQQTGTLKCIKYSQGEYGHLQVLPNRMVLAYLIILKTRRSKHEIANSNRVRSGGSL
jgi:hypothetical protein